MQMLYYLKWPLVIFIFGYLVRVIGALIKIRHWPFADLILVISTGIMIIGLVFLILKLILLKKDYNP